MRILGVEKLTDEKWVNLFAAHFEHNGHAGRWVFASRRPEVHAPEAAGDAVVMVPLLHEPGREPRLVMVREFRVPAGGYVFALPAGLLEKGEAVEAAARREMLEETGLEVTAVKKVSPPVLSSAGLTDESAYLVFVDVRATPQMKPKLETSEDIEVLLLDFAGVSRLCDDRDARIDAKAWAVLYLYQQLGKLA
jgi:ADP-ribose pyrophosphatase